MANAVVEKSQDFSVVLKNSLMAAQAGLPAGFNPQRFVNNALALLNGNDVLKEYVQKYPKVAMGQIKAALLQGAYLDLDAISANAEFYIVPYGSQATFQMSYKGARKLVKKYSVRPVCEIVSEIVREGDLFETETENGKTKYFFKPIPFSNKPVIGAFAAIIYEDGDTLVELMNIEELEKVRNSSKAKSSPAWQNWTNEMRKKCVLKRLCKRVPIEFETPEQSYAYNADEAIETDVKEIVKQEIAENANTVDFAEVIEKTQSTENYEQADFIEG